MVMIDSLLFFCNGVDDHTPRPQRKEMDERKSALDDPEYAAFAWGRYWRIMRWMLLVALLCVIIALGLLWWWNGVPSIHMMIAAALGIGFTVLLAAALMGLVFLSSGTGHDEHIYDPLNDALANDRIDNDE
ncbi:hypothetical protein [Rhizorhapis sp. SPR117]|uniref:hypothetical protein n=1 Tax=Rhizorhapis sp. SPR117 TaxID=2912611 RepID=UPI0030C7F9EE